MRRRERVWLLGVCIAGLATLPAAETDLDPWTVDHFRQAIEAQKAKQFDQAAQQYRLVLSKNPRFAEAYMNLGIGYRMTGDAAAAERAFAAAVSLRPASPDARAALREVRRASR